MGLSGTIQYFSERKARLAEAEAGIEAAAQKLADAADRALAAGKLPALAQAARAAAASDHLAFAALERADGRILWRDASGAQEQPLHEEDRQAALASGRAYRSSYNDQGRAGVAWTIPLKTRSKGAAGITGTRPLGVTLHAGFGPAALRAADSAMAPTLRRLLLAGSISLVLGLIGAVVLSANLTRTIHKLMEGAQQVGAGHFSARVQTRRADELGDLSEEFNAMGRRLGELERLKDSFLAKITHDLRNPLGAIVGLADLLLEGAQGNLSAEQKDSVGLISKSGNDLAELVDNILDVTKLEAGRMNFVPARQELRVAAKSVLALLRLKAEEYGVVLDASGIPEGTSVWADEQGLGRLLTNLVSNALKFTPKGGRVSLSWRRSDTGEDVIVVLDTGIGIPKDKIPTLFEKFSQVEETMNKVRFARGTGLGLVICREIAEGHGGRIWVESEYRQGSSFLVALPPEKA